MSPDGFFSKKQQVFEICDIPESLTFSYQDITEDIDLVLAMVKQHYSQPQQATMLSWGENEANNPIYHVQEISAQPVSDQELEELRGYMLEFVRDVDHHFNPLVYFKYEVYYRLRNRLVWWFRDLRRKIR